MARAPQLHALTSIRGIAAWWVVLYHFRIEIYQAFGPATPVGVMLQGYLAVDLFFVLSGFVIALNYAAMFDRFGLREMAHFLGLRIARIYPLHFVVMVLFLSEPVAYALTGRATDLHAFDPGYYVLSILLVQAWRTTDMLVWNVPSWSISAELVAYLVFPALAWLSARAARALPGAIVAIAVALVLLALGARLNGGGLGMDINRFGAARCVLEFWTGVCLVRIRQNLGAGPAWLSDASCLLAVALLVASAALDLPDYALVPLSFVLLVHGLSDPRGLAARALQGNPLRWIGEISYSTYLVHYLVKDWTKLLLMKPGIPAVVPVLGYVAATACASAALYYLVEVPGRRALRRMMPGEPGGAPVLAAPGRR